MVRTLDALSQGISCLGLKPKLTWHVISRDKGTKGSSMADSQNAGNTYLQLSINRQSINNLETSWIFSMSIIDKAG